MSHQRVFVQRECDSHEYQVGVLMVGHNFLHYGGIPVRLVKVDGSLGPYVGALNEGSRLFHYTEGGNQGEPLRIEGQGFPCRIEEYIPEDQA